jgi:F0F1-type ATP synthase gamma subunit
MGEFGGRVTFLQAKTITKTLVEAYVGGQYDAVKFIFNEFKNAITQKVTVLDFLPFVVSTAEAEAEYKIKPVEKPEQGHYDAIVIAVAHRQFRELGAHGMRLWCKQEHVLYDLKYVLGVDQTDIRL